MSKCLESLENIKREAGTPYFSTLYDIDMWTEDFLIVKKGLKALEILYDKMVDVLSLKVIIDGKLPLYLYNDKVYHHRKLTDEEFKLLKEVL